MSASRMADPEAIKKRFMGLKLELKKRLRLNRARAMNKTSIDRRLEKSILSKSEANLSSSVMKQQIMYELNRSLADNAQRWRMASGDLQKQVNDYEVRVCQLEMDGGRLTRENEKLKELKSKPCDCRAWESRVAQMETKCKEMIDLFSKPLDRVEPPIDASLNDVSASDESAEDNLETSTNQDPKLSLDVPQSIAMPKHLDEAAEIAPEAEKHAFKTIFNMTAISEEGLFTPNTSLNESDRNFLESLPDQDSIKNVEVGVVEETSEPRRDTFTVNNPSQTLALLTPLRLNKRWKNSEVALKPASSPVMAEKDPVPKVANPTELSWDKTKLNWEDMEFTATIDVPIIIPATLAPEGQPINEPVLSIEKVAVVNKPVADSRVPDIEAIPGCSKDYVEPLVAVNKIVVQDSSPDMKIKKKKVVGGRSRKAKPRKQEAATGINAAGDGIEVPKGTPDGKIVMAEVVKGTPRSVSRALSENIEDVRTKTVEFRNVSGKENSVNGKAGFNHPASPELSENPRSKRQKRMVNYAEPSLTKKMRR